MRHLLNAIICLAVIIFSAGVIHAQTQWPHIIPSRDGTPVSYEIYGSGEPTLVFVHGWSCDSRYWRAQVPHFSKKHRVVTLDLAGYGHSGMTRLKYTMSAFGEDVADHFLMMNRPEEFNRALEKAINMLSEKTVRQ